MSTISESELLAQVPSQLYINGKWVDAAGGKTVDVHDPATGLVIKSIADASPADGMKALDAAVAAQDAWAAAVAQQAPQPADRTEPLEGGAVVASAPAPLQAPLVHDADVEVARTQAKLAASKVRPRKA